MVTAKFPSWRHIEVLRGATFSILTVAFRNPEEFKLKTIKIIEQPAETNNELVKTCPCNPDLVENQKCSPLEMSESQLRKSQKKPLFQ